MPDLSHPETALPPTQGTVAMPPDAGGNPTPVRAPRGPRMSCRNWLAEAALRMLMNNLDPEVAERPQDLVVYGASARPRATGNAITRSLRHCGPWKTPRPC